MHVVQNRSDLLRKNNLEPPGSACSLLQRFVQQTNWTFKQRVRFSVQYWFLWHHCAGHWLQQTNWTSSLDHISTASRPLVSHQSHTSASNLSSSLLLRIPCPPYPDCTTNILRHPSVLEKNFEDRILEESLLKHPVPTPTPVCFPQRKCVAMVNRGWVPKSWKDDIEAISKSTGDSRVEVVGVVQPSEEPSQFMPENAPKEGVFHWLDVPSMVSHPLNIQVHRVTASMQAMQITSYFIFTLILIFFQLKSRHSFFDVFSMQISSQLGCSIWKAAQVSSMISGPSLDKFEFICWNIWKSITSQQKLILHAPLDRALHTQFEQALTILVSCLALVNLIPSWTILSSILTQNVLGSQATRPEGQHAPQHVQMRLKFLKEPVCAFLDPISSWCRSATNQQFFTCNWDDKFRLCKAF